VPDANARLTRPQADVLADLNTQIDRGSELLSIPLEFSTQISDVEQRWRSWHQRNKLIIGKSFSNDSALDEYQPVALYSGTGIDPEFAAIKRNVELQLQKLASLRDNLDLVEEVESVETATHRVEQHGDEIFIVHGHSHVAQTHWRRDRSRQTTR